MYKMTLKPMQPFFFGGEHGLSDDGGYDRYYMRSEMFPQQTQLLGMLRKTIMFNQDILKAYPKGDFVPKNKKKEGKELVGESWSIDDEEVNLEQIVSVSPLFLSHDDRLFMQAPLDSGLTLHQREGTSRYNGKVRSAYQLMTENCEAFDAKTYLYDGFLATDGELKESAAIFRSPEQVGNKKLYRGNSDDKSFYKKRSFIFEDRSYGFTFFLKHTGIKPIESTVVTLGADKSKFMLSMQEVEDSDVNCLFADVNTTKAQHRVVLLSDSLVDERIMEHCDFYLAYKRAFRHLGMKDKLTKEKFSKSKRVYFATRGSVFFFESMNNAKLFCDKLDKQKSLSTIGNNQYLFIEGEENV